MQINKIVRYSAALVAALALPVGAATVTDLTYERIFDPSELLRVEITLDDDDWATIRSQTRSMIDAMAPDRHPDSAESPYTYFRADMKINGVEIKNVAVRKKGFIGSLDRTRPSLKVNFKKFEKGRKIASLEKLTLNNNKQDPSALNQVVAYKLFRDAGIVASKANHAVVTVNGENLGIYSNVESIDDEFIKRNFDGKVGTLYEGTVTDFADGWEDKFETKLGKINEYDDIKAVTKALTADDANLLTAVGNVIDLDQFYRFWAVEVLLQHWDGYTGDRNNFFIYRKKGSDQFIFLPWGVDAIAMKNPFWPFQAPTSVYAASALSRRLYDHPVAREQYRATMRELLEEVWDAEAILSEIDRIEALIGEHMPKNVSVEGASRKLKEFVRGRSEAVMAELNGDAPSWEWPLGEPATVTLAGATSGSFSGKWGSLMGNPFADSDVKLNITIGEESWSEFSMIGASAGVSQQPENKGDSTIRIMARQDGSPAMKMISISMKPNVFKPGVHDIDMTTVTGVALEINPATGGFKFLGLLQGRMTLDEAGMNKGDSVSGSFDAEVMMFSGFEQ